MLAITITILPNTLSQANQIVVAGAAKDDRTARLGFVDGMLIKRFAAVMWGLLGMVLLTLYFTYNSDPDLIWGMATRDLLGSPGIGLSGLMIACLMAALMSTASAHMITVSGLLTESVYRPMFHNKSEKNYLLAGRFFCVVYFVGGVAMAMYAKDIWSMFKYLMTIGFVFGAPFLMGIIWRRANAKAAWTSVMVSGAAALLLPLAAPMAGLNKQEAMLKMNYSRELTCTYIASSMDVEERKADIRKWQELNSIAPTTGQCPAELKEGQRFEKTFASQERAIFWDNVTARKDLSGNVVKTGEGMFKADMFLLYCLKVPLEKLSFPMLETLRFVVQFLLSFLTFIVVALFTRPMDKHSLDLFYGRLRTPSYADREKDAEEMAETNADPTRFNHKKLFPGSSWEIDKWDRYEVFGVLKILCWVILIYAGLFAIVMIGS